MGHVLKRKYKMIRYMHIISINADWMKRIETKKMRMFKKKFSKAAVKWFKSYVNKYAIGHRHMRKRKSHTGKQRIQEYKVCHEYKVWYADSIGNDYYLHACPVYI